MDAPQLESIISTLASDLPTEPDVEYFRGLTSRIAATVGVQHAFIAKNGDDVVTFTQAFDFLYNNEFIGPMQYKLAQTPCDDVVNQTRVCHHPIKVQELFPHDEDLKTLKVQGYAGVPILDATGKSLGHIVVMSSTVLRLSDVQRNLLKLFALKLAHVFQHMDAKSPVDA